MRRPRALAPGSSIAACPQAFTHLALISDAVLHVFRDEEAEPAGWGVCARPGPGAARRSEGSAEQLLGAGGLDHRPERLAGVVARAPPELAARLARVHQNRLA